MDGLQGFVQTDQQQTFFGKGIGVNEQDGTDFQSNSLTFILHHILCEKLMGNEKSLRQQLLPEPDL